MINHQRLHVRNTHCVHNTVLLLPPLELHASTFPTFSTTAPSPRILAYLARRGKLPPSSMTIIPVDTTMQVPPPDPVQEPPKVAVTPCGDLWPAPYYYEGGLRRVKPYHYTYNTNCKERWRGRTLVDIFVTEFRDRKPEYYVCFSRERYLDGDWTC